MIRLLLGFGAGALCGVVSANTLTPVMLGWNPSPDTNVTGYLLCSGLVSGQYTNQVEVGNVTNTTVAGLSTNVTYYFVVIAHDGAGNQAPPSNELQVSVSASPATGPTLGLQFFSGTSGAAAPQLNFQASSGVIYQIEASWELVTWSVIWTTNCAVSAAVVFNDSSWSSYPKRFYRLVMQ